MLVVELDEEGRRRRSWRKSGGGDVCRELWPVRVVDGDGGLARGALVVE